MPKINIKTISVNQAWQGKRFKTTTYKQYERDLLLLLPAGIKFTAPVDLYIEVGFSNKSADLDNVVKPFLDILQKKYKFNDKDIYKLLLVKKIVKKGKEYIFFIQDSESCVL